MIGVSLHIKGMLDKHSNEVFAAVSNLLLALLNQHVDRIYFVLHQPMDALLWLITLICPYFLMNAVVSLTEQRCRTYFASNAVGSGISND